MLRPHRKEPPQPQLTALIDVCSMLIIFLIAGTVFGASAIVLPQGLKLPFSFAKQTLSAAPQITIGLGGVTASYAAGQTWPIDAFRPESRAGIEAFRLSTRAFVRENGGKYLNVVADRGLAYRDLYDVIDAFREDGFEALNFISSPLGSAGGGGSAE